MDYLGVIKGIYWGYVGIMERKRKQLCTGQGLLEKGTLIDQHPLNGKLTGVSMAIGENRPTKSI